MSSLFAAVKCGKVEEVKRLVEHATKSDINYLVSDITSDNYGEAAIHQAAAFGSLPILQMLLEKGADPNLCSKDTGWGPLHWGCYAGNVHICRSLLEHGADMNLKDRTGKSPTQIAVSNRRLKLIRFLFDYGNGPIVIDEVPVEASGIPEDVDVVCGQAEIELQKKTIQNLQKIFPNTQDLVVEFLAQARSYGGGDMTAQKFVDFMKDTMGCNNMYKLGMDMARLIKDDGKRKTLLAVLKSTTA